MVSGRLFASSLTASLLALSCSGDGGDGNGDGAKECLNVEGTVSADGLEIRKPEFDAAACIEADNTGREPPRICTKKPEPDFSCVGQKDPLGTPRMVTLRGCVTTFGLGADSYGLVITVLREKDANGNPVDPGYDVMGTPGMQDENSPAAVIGRTISTQVALTECADGGAYELANVPTETDLVVRVTHQQEASDDRLYVDTYQYNFRLRNSEIVQEGGVDVVRDDVNTITIATFSTIPRAAGVSVITGENNLFDGSGQGHIAGEIQDCSSEHTVQNAVVAIDSRARKLAYFNVDFEDRDNIEDPKPEGTRTRTNADGLYAAIGVDTGAGGKPVKVGAAITRKLCGADGVCPCTEDRKTNPAYAAADEGEGEVTVLGARTVYVFPDSITIMTFDKGLYTAP